MSQIPRRTTLSLTQPPKIRKPTQATEKTVHVDTKVVETIVIEDVDLGNTLENDDLIQVLDRVEDRNGSHVADLHDHGDALLDTKKAAAPDNTLSSVSIRLSSDSTDVAANNESNSAGEKEPPIEMEPLIIADDDDDEFLVINEKSVSSYDSPRPNLSGSGGTKVVRLTKGMRLSPFRQPLDNVSTIVNLSTVSEQSDLDSPQSRAEEGTEQGIVLDGADDDAARTHTRISARRTFATNRPLRELGLRNAMRVSAYPTSSPPAYEEETANDTRNATAGSEIDIDDLPDTPVGQKRRRNGSDDEEDEVPPPKKNFLQTYCAIM